MRGDQLRYTLLPIVDELTPLPDGSWTGRGLSFGVELCRFRLKPRAAPAPRTAASAGV